MKQSVLTELVLQLDSRVHKLETHIAELESLLRQEEQGDMPRRRRRKPRSLLDYEIDLERLHLMSDSELVRFCRALGHPTASRAHHRDDLTHLILGEHVDVFDAIGEIRETIHTFVRGNRSIISAANMDCDFNCPACPHDKVVACWSVNRDFFSQE